MELRSKYIGDLDMAFRLGFEQGQQQAQQDQAQQAQAQQQQLEQAGMGQESGFPGQEESLGAPTIAQGPAQAGRSELDKHINELEGMLGKSEVDVNVLKKTLESIKSAQKAQLEQLELRKSAAAIPEIAKALHKPQFKLGVQASHNLSANAKTAVSLQHKIVNEVLAKMEEETKKASNDISNLLNIEGLINKG